MWFYLSVTWHRLCWSKLGEGVVSGAEFWVWICPKTIRCVFSLLSDFPLFFPERNRLKYIFKYKYILDYGGSKRLTAPGCTIMLRRPCRGLSFRAPEVLEPALYSPFSLYENSSSFPIWQIEFVQIFLDIHTLALWRKCGINGIVWVGGRIGINGRPMHLQQIGGLTVRQ